MTKILQFPKKRASRASALRWVSHNISIWPEYKAGLMSDDIFHGWRFIGVDGIVYFANCLDRGITASERIALQEGIRG